MLISSAKYNSGWYAPSLHGQKVLSIIYVLLLEVHELVGFKYRLDNNVQFRKLVNPLQLQILGRGGGLLKAGLGLGIAIVETVVVLGIADGAIQCLAGIAGDEIEDCVGLVFLGSLVYAQTYLVELEGHADIKLLVLDGQDVVVERQQRVVLARDVQLGAHADEQVIANSCSYAPHRQSTAEHTRTPQIFHLTYSYSYFIIFLPTLINHSLLSSIPHFLIILYFAQMWPQHLSQPKLIQGITSTMYSSCPNIIRHFIPLQFSEATIDYRTTAPLISAKPKHVQMPFTNMKLQSLQNNPKDYILIFKNKTNKDYSPRQKVKYSSLLKEMKTSNTMTSALAKEKPYQDSPLISTSNVQGRKAQKTELVRPRLIQSMHKLRGHGKNYERTRTCDSKQRLKISSHHCSARQARSAYKSAKQNGELVGTGRGKQQIDGEVTNLVQFKIRGSRAPKEETVDFFKQIKLDMNYRLVQKLLK